MVVGGVDGVAQVAGRLPARGGAVGKKQIVAAQAWVAFGGKKQRTPVGVQKRRGFVGGRIDHFARVFGKRPLAIWLQFRKPNVALTHPAEAVGNKIKCATVGRKRRLRLPVGRIDGYAQIFWPRPFFAI